MSSDTSFTSAVALEKILPGDNVHVYLANLSDENRFCQGDGDGTFSFCVDAGFPANDSRGLATGILDTFGVDAVFANAGTNRWCLVFVFFGGVAFDCEDVGTDMHESAGVAIGDLDGDADLIFANRSALLGERNRLCLNDGVDFPSCVDVSVDSFQSHAVTLSAFTAPFGDGILDAPAEECDDGNQLAGDCCSATCEYEIGRGSPPRCQDGACLIGQSCGLVCFVPGQCAMGGAGGNECVCGVP